MTINSAFDRAVRKQFNNADVVEGEEYLSPERLLSHAQIRAVGQMATRLSDAMIHLSSLPIDENVGQKMSDAYNAARAMVVLTKTAHVETPDQRDQLYEDANNLYNQGVHFFRDEEIFKRLQSADIEFLNDLEL